MRLAFYSDLSDDFLYRGPRTYSRKQLQVVPDLFAHRVALFFTPTSRMPDLVVGQGELRVRLPVPTPNLQEVMGLRAYSNPRFWVDLLQRATGKIRWQPIWPAHVKIVRYDSSTLPLSDLAGGLKALIDALKVSTAGRRDGRRLHYFGAIRDDDAKSITHDWHQRLVTHPRLAHLTVIVREV